MKRGNILVCGVLVMGMGIGAMVSQMGLHVVRAEGTDSAAPGAMLNSKDISTEQAQKVVMAAMAKSKEIKTKMDIAVVDAGGNLKAFVREDGAWLGSIDISIKKAKTARYFDMNTGEVG